MPCRNLFTAILLFLTGLLWAPLSSAEARGGTVTVVHSDNERLSVRIGAELTSAGYTVRTAVLPPPVSTETLRSLAREQRVVAIMQILPGENTVRIWTVNRTGEKPTELEEVTAPQAGDVAESVAAFKAVELLRARLMPLPPLPSESAPASEPTPESESGTTDLDGESSGEAQPTPAEETETDRARTADENQRSAAPAEPPPPEETPSPPRQNRRKEIRWKDAPRLTASLQPAAVFPFGGLKPTLNIGLSLYVRLAPLLGLEVAGLIPTFSQSKNTTQGTVALRTGVITGGLRLNLLPPGFRVTPAISVTGGPLLVRARGRDAAEGYKGVDVLKVGAALSGMFTLSVAVTRTVSVRADASCGAALAVPTLEDSDKRAFGTYGKLLLTVLVGIEVRLL